MSVCLCRFDMSFTYKIESIDSKLTSVSLINDYLLIADLDIFVYGSTECATISLECTKVMYKSDFRSFSSDEVQDKEIIKEYEEGLIRLIFCYFHIV